MSRVVFVSFLALVVTAFVHAEEKSKSLLNLDKSGLAIQGYDPVAYFTDHKAVKGDEKFKAEHNGATYYFSSDEHRAMFEKEPAKYEPLFGGYCGYGASRNALAPITPDAFVIVDGHLVLQKSKRVLGYWNEDPQENFKKAQSNWPGLVEKNSK